MVTAFAILAMFNDNAFVNFVTMNLIMKKPGQLGKNKKIDQKMQKYQFDYEKSG